MQLPTTHLHRSSTTRVMKNNKMPSKKKSKDSQKISSAIGSAIFNAPAPAPIVSSADDSYIKRLPPGLLSQDIRASTLTTPRRPTNEKFKSNLLISFDTLPSPETQREPRSADRILSSPLRHRDTAAATASDQDKYTNKYPSLPSEWMKTPARPKHESSSSSSASSHPPQSLAFSSSSDDYLFDFHKFSWKKFLLAEIFGIGDPGHLEPMAVETIDNFLSVPWELEKLLLFGFVITLDSFLYTITYLPIRFLLALLLLIDECLGYYVLSFRPFQFLYLALLTLNVSQSYQKASLSQSHHSHSHSQSSPHATSPHRLHYNHFDYSSLRQFDLMRGLLLIIGSWALSHVDMPRLYHYIRMQNTIKLYVLTAMMEIFDKLFSSFGLDALDSLFWKTRIRSSSYAALLSSFLIALIYVLIHSSLYFIHISTLIVAINNADQSLLTILILNNFAEIKSFVLKKYDEETLYQLVCADIYERFKIFLFSVFALVSNCTQSSDLWRTFLEHSEIFCYILSAEVLVDWIKHAFIIKLNSPRVSSKAYGLFDKQLRAEIFYGHKDKITLDHSYAVTKTIGIAQYPLGCIFFRFILIGLVSSKKIERFQYFTFSDWFGWIVVSMLALVLFKIILSVMLIYTIGKKNNSDIEREIKRKQREVSDQRKWDELQQQLIGEEKREMNMSQHWTASISCDDDDQRPRLDR
jgi:hypothetical protein